LGEVREAGHSMVAFRTVLSKHRGERRIERKIAELEGDDAETYEMMVDALAGLADTPLGEAALDRKRRPRPARRQSRQPLERVSRPMGRFTEAQRCAARRPRARLSVAERTQIAREYEHSRQLGYCGSAWIASQHGISRNHVTVIVRNMRRNGADPRS
jgi:hypothetical protein